MWARILYTVAMVALPVATWAQDGLRSASLPERSLASTRSPARGDLFLAEPDTYARLDDRHAMRDHRPLLLLGGCWYVAQAEACALQVPYVGDFFMEAGREGSSYGYEGRRPAETRPKRQRRDVGSDSPTRPDAWDQAPPPAERSPAVAPGIPKTFYVIAGCYAGDAPPRPDRLPPDCDPSKVRVISP